MRAQKLDQIYLIRLERGEKLMQSLSQLVLEENIGSGSLTGIGATEHNCLAYYNLEQKQYVQKDFPAESELVSFMGNVSWVEDRPLIHAHVVLSDTEYQCFGGHLMEAQVAVTVELTLRLHPTRLERQFDSEVGLNLMHLPCHVLKF